MHVMAARVLTKTTFLYRPTCPRTYCASRSADVTRQERDMSRLTSVCIDGILLQEGVRALAPMAAYNKCIYASPPPPKRPQSHPTKTPQPAPAPTTPTPQPHTTPRQRPLK